ncbi:DUF2786 domain-containing protein [Enterococcus faecium]|uniref:DUF2786 domain-containing protein n=1 Tax=Enterococcus faecium TaxID=1352 RepID=UPI000CF0FB0B|nr:DUF2786 domain-containing protein [Enterococcus faecium]EGP4892153.1 DUF2786 domain-containing protein [Enterococcus faecium]EME3574745.1 DUF2786 domain-containing protein [Enterococcus faecium]EME7152357.1 DUF2786 domain-containing protein [Enterococcus faecium]EME8074801.1 DUF2786 domain-containing protein [Enterococcus faecium]EME8145381.1 DUF2786 domain-containing protein [Enterococcus faecium]
MTDKRKEKIQKLLALAADANDEESMSALAKAQQLMLDHNFTEDEIFNYREQQRIEEVETHVIYRGRPQKWLYRLASIIAQNFRTEFYYREGSPIDLCFTGLDSDVQIAEITFQYASGSVSYCARKYMQQPEIKRKRKWQLKQDYIQGYLSGLSKVFKQQVLTNGYELALQLPEAVKNYMESLSLVPGKDMSHKVENPNAYYSGYKDGLNQGIDMFHLYQFSL